MGFGNLVRSMFGVPSSSVQPENLSLKATPEQNSTGTAQNSANNTATQKEWSAYRSHNGRNSFYRMLKNSLNRENEKATNPRPKGTPSASFSDAERQSQAAQARHWTQSGFEVRELLRKGEIQLNEPAPLPNKPNFVAAAAKPEGQRTETEKQELHAKLQQLYNNYKNSMHSDEAKAEAWHDFRKANPDANVREIKRMLTQISKENGAQPTRSPRVLPPTVNPNDKHDDFFGRVGMTSYDEAFKTSRQDQVLNNPISTSFSIPSYGPQTLTPKQMQDLRTCYDEAVAETPPALRNNDDLQVGAGWAFKQKHPDVDFLTINAAIREIQGIK